jgi:hypothetical protein
MLSNGSQDYNFLTVEESAAVDQALLSSREKFSARVAIYSLRVLKQIAQQEKRAIAQISQAQLIEWIHQDKNLEAASIQGLDARDPSFTSFFAQLVLSALKPLNQISAEANTPLEEITPTQVLTWFEKEAKIRVEQGPDQTFLK